METIYYHLNTRRAKVSGGPDVMYLTQPVSEPVPEGGAQVLDFERAKLRLERKDLLKQALAEPGYAPEELRETKDAPIRAEASEKSARTHKLFLGLDLMASVSILAVCVTAIKAFTAVL